MPSFQFDPDEIHVSFPFRPTWVEAIKRLRRRRFDPATKVWSVPTGLAPDLLAALEGAGAPWDELAPLRDASRDALARTAALQASWRRVYEDAVPTLAERYPGLFRHQEEGAAFLLGAGRGVILADEMGLGKTRQAIVAADALGGRVLVVCPAGLKLNWARELRMALGAPDLHVVDAKGLGAARWTIMSYDLVKRHHKALLARHWGVAILDEAHYIKNRTSQRTRLLVGGDGKRGLPAGRVRGVLAQADRVFLLTGTPITSRPLDLFPLLQALEHPLGDDLMAFAGRYCAAFFTGFGWDLKGASHLDELHERLAGVLLRRVKEEVLDLPPKLRTYMPVEVDLAAYRRVWLDYAARRKKKRRLGKRALLVEIAKLRHAAAIAKIPAALALVEDVLAQGEKVIVFSGYQAVVDAFLARFGAQAVRVTGRMGAKAREASVAAFQEDPAVGVFVGNLKAAGVGITLTAAQQVIFTDYSFVPADHLQAEDRPCRIGQRTAVTITYLSAVGTIDEEVEQLLAHKLDVVGQAIDGAEASLSGSFLDDLLAIVALS
ncbi:MAG: SWI/SNF-related matrix-associated actin-dependent regulator 1 of chromatin subfamily [Cyanobacteria bacterium RYN_339]|nr:SWI/SNF-related matrix-associated actin-dependent regulator 1 of chromatin subfamily [Cyanobacteria bacterium RYN_339]